MGTYFVQRILGMIPTFLGVTILVFMMTRFVPGGPVERILQQFQQESVKQTPQTSVQLSEDDLNSLKSYYGLDQNVFVAYYSWFKKLLSFDLGVSTRYQEPVTKIISERMPISFWYGISTFIFSLLIAVPLGVLKAIKMNSFFDLTSSAVLFLVYSLPSYIVAVVLILVFSVNFEIFPLGGVVSDNFDQMSFFQKLKDILYHSALPFFTYLLGSFAWITFLIRNALHDQFASEYVRTAVAKGASFNRIVWKHAFRNSLVPFASNIGSFITGLISGSFLIETVFNIDGFGFLAYESLVERDYPVVLGILVLSSVLYIFGNLFSDLCVALLDPRINFHEKK